MGTSPINCHCFVINDLSENVQSLVIHVLLYAPSELQTVYFKFVKQPTSNKQYSFLRTTITVPIYIITPSLNEIDQ